MEKHMQNEMDTGLAKGGVGTVDISAVSAPKPRRSSAMLYPHIQECKLRKDISLKK